MVQASLLGSDALCPGPRAAGSREDAEAPGDPRFPMGTAPSPSARGRLWLPPVYCLGCWVFPLGLPGLAFPKCKRKGLLRAVCFFSEHSYSCGRALDSLTTQGRAGRSVSGGAGWAGPWGLVARSTWPPGPPLRCSLRGPWAPLLWPRAQAWGLCPACSEALALSPGALRSAWVPPPEEARQPGAVPQPAAGAGGLRGLPERPQPPSLCRVSCCSG